MMRMTVECPSEKKNPTLFRVNLRHVVDRVIYRRPPHGVAPARSRHGGRQRRILERSGSAARRRLMVMRRT